MEGMDRFETHPARDATVRSMAAVEAGSREGWLAQFAEDAVVEDPIGPSMFDPEGKGHHGHDGIGAFYDTVVSTGEVRFAIRESYAAGDECANVGTITTTFPDGGMVDTDLVMVYRVDERGRVASMRAYWEPERAMATYRKR